MRARGPLAAAVRGVVLLAVLTLPAAVVAGSRADAARALPLVEVPSGPDGDVLAILLTGDGGWAPLVRTVAKELSARGVAVVALNSRDYFAPGRTPDETAADVARLLRTYGARWHRSRAALVGYSRGADVLPFVATRLPADLRDRLTALAMLGLAPRANFHFHWMDVVRDVRRPDDLATLPELRRLASVRMLCVYGVAERESACRDAPPGLMRVVARPGAHHFDGDYHGLGALVAETVAAPDGHRP